MCVRRDASSLLLGRGRTAHRLHSAHVVAASQPATQRCQMKKALRAFGYVFVCLTALYAAAARGRPAGRTAPSSTTATALLPTPDPRATLTAVLLELSGSCPALAMEVDGPRVKTTGATTFSGARDCSELANGDAVSVSGTLHD